MSDSTALPNFWERTKAFITDMFLIYTPLLYLLTYVVLGDKESFQQGEWPPLLATVVFGLIVTLFWSIKGQTPGQKAYKIRVVDNQTGQKISFFRAYIRFFLLLIGATFLFGILMPLWRKDRKALHDLLSQTKVIYEDPPLEPNS